MGRGILLLAAWLFSFSARADFYMETDSGFDVDTPGCVGVWNSPENTCGVFPDRFYVDTCKPDHLLEEQGFIVNGQANQTPSLCVPEPPPPGGVFAAKIWVDCKSMVCPQYTIGVCRTMSISCFGVPVQAGYCACGPLG